MQCRRLPSIEPEVLFRLGRHGLRSGAFQRHLEEVEVADDDGQRVADVVDHLRGGQSEHRHAAGVRKLVLKFAIEPFEFPEGAVLAAVLVGARDVLPDEPEHVVHIERFAEVVVRAEPDGLAGRRQVSVAGEHDDGRVSVDLADEAQSLDPGHAGHLDVADDDIRRGGLQRRDTGGDAVGEDDLVVVLEKDPQALPRTLLVVDHQHAAAGGIAHGQLNWKR